MAPLLLIDGDRNFRQALAIALRLDGYEVTAADSLEAARPDLERGAYDFVVVDLRLAGAAELIDRLAGDPGAAAVATSIDPDLIAETQRRHPRLVALQKPFRVEDLRAILGAGHAAVA